MKKLKQWTIIINNSRYMHHQHHHHYYYYCCYYYYYYYYYCCCCCWWRWWWWWWFFGINPCYTRSRWSRALKAWTLFLSPNHQHQSTEEKLLYMYTYVLNTCVTQGRSRRSGWSGFNLTTFRPIRDFFSGVKEFVFHGHAWTMKSVY